MATIQAPPLTSSESAKRQCLAKMVDTPQHLVLESYADNYTGHLKIDRLLFIAQRCPALQTTAYQLALDEIKANTLDTKRYTQVAAKLNTALEARTQPTVELDQAWIEQTQRQAKQRFDILEADLKSYRSNLIKDSIRIGLNDLAAHQYAYGDTASAIKNYSRAREYCSTSAHVVRNCLDIIHLSHETGTFANIAAQVAKAESTPDAQQQPAIQAKLQASHALLRLESGAYKQVAELLTTLSFDALQQANYSHVVSANDVAVYGGLCALATFDRRDLRALVLDSTNFKQYMELEPQIRELALAYHQANYAQCIQLLQSWRNDFLLDIHLHTHVDALFGMIRRGMLLQYVRPYQKVSLERMAAAFAGFYTPESLQTELVDLITSKLLKARINDEEKELCMYTPDPRHMLYHTTLQSAAAFEQQTRASLLHLQLKQANLNV